MNVQACSLPYVQQIKEYAMIQEQRADMKLMVLVRLRR